MDYMQALAQDTTTTILTTTDHSCMLTENPLEVLPTVLPLTTTAVAKDLTATITGTRL